MASRTAPPSATLPSAEDVAARARAAALACGADVDTRRGEREGRSPVTGTVVSRLAWSSPEDVERDFEGRGYGDLKTAVGDEVAEWLAPVRERYEELRADEAALEEMLAEGAERARAIAGPVVADVRAAMGVGPARRSVWPAA